MIVDNENELINWALLRGYWNRHNMFHSLDNVSNDICFGKLIAKLGINEEEEP